MATFRISEADAVANFAGLLARVRAGEEVVIESGRFPVAIVRIPSPPNRTIEEAIALMPEDSSAVMDDDFARDVETAIAAHQDDSLNPPAWD